MKRASLLAAALLGGCAPSVTSQVGHGLANGTTLSAPTANAVRVHSKANLLHQGKRLKFDVWIEADSSQGRMDALGPFGTPLATVIWQDSSWRAWLPGQSTLLRGKGNAVNLPVLGLKDIRPSLLVAPLLGRTMSNLGPVKAISAGTTQTLVLPATAHPGWSLLIDKATGLPSRRQTLLEGREIEGLTFHKWKRQGEILVPGILDRSTPDGQLLELDMQEWNAIASVPPEHLQLKLQGAIDTITLDHNDRGQTVYHIRTAGSNGGDSTSVVLSNPHVMSDAPLDNGQAGEDSLLTDGEEDETDSTAVEEEVDPAAQGQTPAAPAPPASKPAGIPATIPTQKGSNR